MCAHEVDYHNGLVTVVCSLRCNSQETFKEDASVSEKDQKVAMYNSKMTLLDACHQCVDVRYFKEEGGYAWCDVRPRLIAVVRCDGQLIGKVKTIERSRMFNYTTTIAHTDRSFLSVMEAVLNLAGTLQLQFGALISEMRIRDIVIDLMSSSYLSTRSRSSYIQYGWLVHFMTSNKEVVRLLKSPNEEQNAERELEVTHLGSDILHAIRSHFLSYS